MSVWVRRAFIAVLVVSAVVVVVAAVSLVPGPLRDAPPTPSSPVTAPGRPPSAL
jgi:hypothetical protein